MTETKPYKYADLVKKIVDGFPPLTAEQRAKLSILLRGGPITTKESATDAAA
ncbi:hypothetical protein [Streptosporangium sp. NPDC006930]|uniref:hypothetical protein n=1 Tax=Streptosporangium sp. NPDC006930 TaxID=3154783 RepID=UPI00341BC52E